jgi:hypothetical protein
LSSETSTGERVVDTATAVSELIRDATARITHLLTIEARIGAQERRELEEAAEDLRAALHYLDTHLRTLEPQGGP